MAEGKKSFMFYCDWIDTFKALPREDGYDLFIHLLDYVNDKNPVSKNPIVNGIFPIIRNQLKRDLKKWEVKADRSRENGKLGGRPKKEPKKPSGLINNLEEPKKPVTVKVTVKDKVIVKDINKRKADFKKSLIPFLENYDSNLLNDFYLYWTEHGENDRKMRFEKQKSFGINLRLATWLKNQKRFEKEKSPEKKEKRNAGEIIKERYGLS